ARLRRAVDHEVEAGLPEQRRDSLAVPDVEVVVLKVARLRPQAGEVPGRISRLAEEAAAHVVVDADDAPSEAIEGLHRFGADEAAAAGDEDGLLLGHLTFPRVRPPATRGRGRHGRARRGSRVSRA